MAGHCCLGCRPPHLPQPACLGFGVDFLRSMLSMPAVGLSLVSDFSCVKATSLDQHISRAVCRVRDDFQSNLLCVLSSRTPSTMQSLIRLSVSLSNSHALAFVKSTLTRVCNLHSSSVDGVFHK